MKKNTGKMHANSSKEEQNNNKKWLCLKKYM